MSIPGVSGGLGSRYDPRDTQGDRSSNGDRMLHRPTGSTPLASLDWSMHVLRMWMQSDLWGGGGGGIQKIYIIIYHPFS